MDPRTRDMARRGAIGAVAMGWGWETDTDRGSAPPRASLPVWLRIVAFLGVGAMAAVLVGFVAFVYSLDRVERRPTTRTDAIVALTGGAQRIGDAIDLLDRGYATRLLITGVNERTSREQIARLNPGQRRLFDCCVDLDYRARNTIGNAIETRRWMQDNGFRSLIVVTSNYHMRRTLLELDNVMPGARKVPFAVVPEAIDVDSWWRSPGTAKFLAYEYAKLIAVYLRTRFETDPERSAAASWMGGGRPVKVVAEPFVRR
jgi:uncharacterized SAM-binding protein YcdF (DUF218 family)